MLTDQSVPPQPYRVMNSLKRFFILFGPGFFAGILGALAIQGFNSYRQTPTLTTAVLPSAGMQQQMPPLDEGEFPLLNLRGCDPELAGICKDSPLEMGGAVGCLVDVYDQLNPLCQQSVLKFKDQWTVCDSEIKRFCPDVKPGKRRLPTCLQKHEKQLGEECAKLVVGLIVK